MEVTEVAKIGLLSLEAEIGVGGWMAAWICDCGTMLAIRRFPARHSECC